MRRGPAPWKVRGRVYVFNKCPGFVRSGPHRFCLGRSPELSGNVTAGVYVRQQTADTVNPPIVGGGLAPNGIEVMRNGGPVASLRLRCTALPGLCFYLAGMCMCSANHTAAVISDVKCRD